MIQVATALLAALLSTSAAAANDLARLARRAGVPLAISGAGAQGVIDSVKNGAGARDAGDFFLTRTLQSATLVRNAGGQIEATLKALLAGELDAYAANRMRLHNTVQQIPGSRLMPDNFYGVEQAVIVPKGTVTRLKIIETVIDEVGSHEYRDDKSVLYRSSRPWNNQWAAVGLGTTAFPDRLVDNVRLGAVCRMASSDLRHQVRSRNY